MMSRRRVRVRSPLSFSLLALLAALAASPVRATGETVTVAPASPTDLDRLTLTLSGEWPDSCTPQLLGVELKGAVIEVEADITFGAEVCLPAVTPYAVSIEVGPLPAGDYEVEARGIPHFPPPVLIARTSVEVAASADLGVEGIAFAPPSPTTQDRVTIGGFGTWDDGCVPGVEGIEVADRSIRLRAVAGGGDLGCVLVFTPFLLAADVGPLAEGDWQVEVLIADRRFDPQAPFALAGERTLRIGAKQSDVLVLGGRFGVTVTWTDGATRSGVGQPIRGALPQQGETGSGAFWFFEPSNAELLVKVLDACAVNDRYWVFISAATDLGFEVLVEDFAADGLSKTYSNPPGATAIAVTDVGAFATCD
ncbi:MAG TPA: hypothetical protein VMV46_09970 [Thermoanaerobaculia bacterium]|nr:hypothetical protein [Thermoanaerobaculia bacterium]